MGEREYKIVTSTLGFNIYRKKQLEWKMFNMEWLGANLKWIKDKDFAKTFYHREDAVSALVIIKKKKWELTTEQLEEEKWLSIGEQKEKAEKQCWSDF